MSWVGWGSQGVTGWNEESHQARADLDLVCVLSLWPLGKSQNSLRPAAAHLVFADPPDSLKRHWSLGWGPVSSTESSPELPQAALAEDCPLLFNALSARGAGWSWAQGSELATGSWRVEWAGVPGRRRVE